MKVRLNSLSVLLLFGIIATPALAVSNESLEASMKNLQQEVASLKSQLKANQQSNPTSSNSNIHANPNPIITNAAPNPAPSPNRPNLPLANSSYHHHTPTKEVKNLTLDVPLPTVNKSTPHPDDTSISPPISPNPEEYYLPFDPDVPGQAFVTTGPYLGVRIQYAGTNLIVTSPSVNTDVQLLDIRKKIIKQLQAIMGTTRLKPTHSHLLFSGIIETQVGYVDHAGGPSTTDIDVTNLSLDAIIFGPSDWLLGFIEFTMDNSSPFDSVFLSRSHYRVGNSRIFVNKGFVTIGNFTCSPWYTSFGQFYVPFGVYSSVMVSDPLTKLLGRTKARSILIGYHQQTTNAFYAAAYIFRGDAHASSVAKIDNGGINVGYRFSTKGKYPIKGNFGGGVISNLADSAGVQVGNNFQEFEQMVHRVRGYNLRGVLSVTENIDIIAEWISAARRFNRLDMSFNHHGAKPSAYDIEVSYSFPICEKPSSIGVGYNKSSQALAMGLPLTRSFIVFNTSLWRYTLQSLELRLDRQYAESDVATRANNDHVRHQNGNNDFAATLQFDYYF